MDERLKRFEELFRQEPAGAVSVRLLLSQLPPDVAGALRLAAIPHELDATLLEAMWPQVRGRGEALCNALRRLSMVTTIEGRLSLNRSAREFLLGEWLRAARGKAAAKGRVLEEASQPFWPEGTPPLPSFEEANARLERHFEAAIKHAGAPGSAPVAARVFHAVAADPERGIALLGETVEASRRWGRFGAAQTLLRLVRDLEPILQPDERSLLDFLDAVIAYDSARPDAAARGLAEVASNPATPPERRLRALVWQGLVHRRQGRMAEALEVFERAYGEASSPAGQSRAIERELVLALSEMAQTHLARGDADAALGRLEEALGLARRAQDSAGTARILNGLGQALASTGQLARARATFEEAAALASAEDDQLLAARILHNGANVAAEQDDLEAAEKLFEQSIEKKRAARDELGEAMSLASLASVLWRRSREGDAARSIARAIAIFDDLGDLRHASLARQNRARRYIDAGRIDLARSDCETAARDFERIGLTDLAKTCRAALPEPDAKGGKKRRWVWWVIALVVLGLLALVLI
jgi:tetratricopeptide (TPR) repeat protein